jgi:hypothetical protein
MSQPLYHQVVARAREILEDPSRWTAGELATDSMGASVEPTDDEAQRFCAVGALMRATSEFTSDALAAEILAYQTHLALVDFAGIPEGHTTLERINDHQGHRAVLVIFDEYLRGRLAPAGN